MWKSLLSFRDTKRVAGKPKPGFCGIETAMFACLTVVILMGCVFFLNGASNGGSEITLEDQPPPAAPEEHHSKPRPTMKSSNPVDSEAPRTTRKPRKLESESALNKIKERKETTISAREHEEEWAAPKPINTPTPQSPAAEDAEEQQAPMATTAVTTALPETDEPTESPTEAPEARTEVPTTTEVPATTQKLAVTEAPTEVPEIDTTKVPAKSMADEDAEVSNEVLATAAKEQLAPTQAPVAPTEAPMEVATLEPNQLINVASPGSEVPARAPTSVAKRSTSPAKSSNGMKEVDDELKELEWGEPVDSSSNVKSAAPSLEAESLFIAEVEKVRKDTTPVDVASPPPPPPTKRVLRTRETGPVSSEGRRASTTGTGFDKDPMSTPDDVNYPYCTLTNPPPNRRNHTTCISGNPEAANEFVVVVTISEEELRRSVDVQFVEENPDGMLGGGNQQDGTAHYRQSLQTKRPGDQHALSWLDELPLKKHIYVKSNWTISYRRNNATWDPRIQEKLSHEEMYWEYLNRTGQSDAAILQYRRLHNGTLPFPTLSNATRPLKTQPRHVFRSIAHDLLRGDPSVVSITELPNIADEAISMLWHVTNRVHGVSTHGLTAKYHPGDSTGAESKKLTKLAKRTSQGSEGVPPYTIFLHGHSASWHSVDVVREQLSCLCMDKERERYKTLTYGEKAFLFQCVPIKMPPLLANPRNAIERMEQRMQKNLTHFTDQFQYEWKQLLEEELGPHPTAVIRDCCASFVVHRDHILRRRKKFFQHLYNITRHQPYGPFMRRGLERDLSLFLERLWRTIFNATWTDNVRDFGNIKCTHERVQSQRQKLFRNMDIVEKQKKEKRRAEAKTHLGGRLGSKVNSTEAPVEVEDPDAPTNPREFLLFDCPPWMTLKTMDDIPVEYRNRKCPKAHRNIFQ